MQRADRAAAETASPPGRPERRAPPRNVLFRRYAGALMGLVLGALLLQGSLELAADYQIALGAAETVQRAEVGAAATRIGQFLEGVERHFNEVGNLPWASGTLGLQERRDEYHRLMKLVPAITEIASVAASGREAIRASRVQPDEIDSGRDLGGDAVFRQALRDGRAYSATFFREGSEPFLTLATRDRERGAVTLAEINLRYAGEVVGRIRIGESGLVYVVDNADHVVAHPDVSVVLRKTRLASYEPLRRLRAASAAGSATPMLEALGLDGREVMVSAAPIPSANWLVVAEQPRREVLRPVYGAVARTALVVLLAVVAALAVGAFLARRLARPILEVRQGADKLARGDLATRIDVRTGDDVESLAQDFNRMADQLQDYTVGLERRVAEKTAQLEAANRHKSEFLANMSHELRTPLNAIIGFSEALKERMFGDLNPKQMEYVSDIHASGLHLLSLINDILDLTKVEAGRMELDERVLDVAAAIDNCCTLVRERVVRHALRLTVEVEPGLAWRADERKLKQVLLNLLSNAAKFTPAGGEIRVRAHRREGDLVIEVEDTGIGIAAADQELVFEAFQQVRSPSGTRHEGTGLGLPLSRRMVELHGGTLTVRSEPGRGSTFTARFPARSARQ